MPKRAKQPNPPPTLAEVLTARASHTAPPLHWSEADRALFSSDYDAAILAYAAAADIDPVESAKHGFSLGMQGDDDEAEALLSEANVGPHPEAQALLAWVLGGSWGNRMPRGLSAEAKQSAAARRARVEALIDAALSSERPPKIAFYVLFTVLGTYDPKAGAQAARARVLYPDWDWPHALVARKQRVAGEPDPRILDDLMRTLPGSSHEEVFFEAYVYAMRLSRWDDVNRVIDTLEQLVIKDNQPGDGNRASLAEMRAMLWLHRARAGEPGAYAKVLSQLAEFEPAVPYITNGRDPTAVPRFHLQVALETGQEGLLREAASALVARAWDSHGDMAGSLDLWSSLIATPSLEGVLQVGHFEFDISRRWRDVETALDGTLRDRWRVMLAADAILNFEPTPDQVAILCAAPTQGLPWWVCRAKYEALETHSGDHEGAGALLAELAERAAAVPSEKDDRYPTLLESLYVSVKDLNDPVTLFTGSLTWLRATPAATGHALLERWGAELAEINGGKAVLSSLANLSLSRADSAIARQLKELAEMPDTPQKRLSATLKRYPQPETTRLNPEDLSLLEAASLIALLRASQLDHVHWTLAPLSASGQGFEPTKKFIGTLFGLMAKGVIAMDETTPAGIVMVEDDGRLKAYLEHVVWRISSNTLALQRAIRDLPLKDWPQTWRDHAPALSRDLGVEELVAYLDHLLTDRNLPAPKMDDARGLFRMQLEHLSVAQGYYLAHKSVRETLDYQARYRPGRAQLESRIISLLRGNGERAIAHGWDTRYERIRELPASLLWEALHDVLTRWGRAAFEDPVMTLTLE